MEGWNIEDVEAIQLALRNEQGHEEEDENQSVADHLHTPSTSDRTVGGCEFTSTDLFFIREAMKCPSVEVGNSMATPGTQMMIREAQESECQVRGTSRADIVLQRRPGTHHGRGGRPRGLSKIAPSQEVSNRVGSVAVKAFISRLDGISSALSARLRTTALSLMPDSENWEPPPGYEDKLEELIRSIKSDAPRTGYTILSSPVLCISSNIGTKDSTGLPSGNIKDRYGSCVWLDVEGTMHCSCFGSTKHRILRPLFRSWSFTNDHVCPHMSGLMMLIGAVAASMQLSFALSGKVLSHLYALISPSELGEYMCSVPRIHVTHSVKGNATITILAELEAGTKELSFIPIRTVRKGVKRNICLFCDNTGRRECHHVRSINVLQNEDVEDPGSYTTQAYSFDSISYLPLGPVNCFKSLEVDLEACETARNGQAFLARAPMRCKTPGCNGNRVEKSRKVYTDGVLMCTIGPCLFYYEYYECSSCRSRIGAEGRENYIVIEKVTSAATHAFLRRELIGLALTVGTLSGRLKHFHSQVTASQYFKLLKSGARCLSITSLRSLALIMLRLMCSNPPKDLFTCQTCEFENGQRRPRLRALCMDGINQGHLKRCQKAFQNISEACSALPLPRLKGRSSSRDRPLDNIIRKSGTIEVLLSAIQGRNPCCTRTNLVDFVAAARLISEDILPPGFCPASICGRSNADYFNDIGIDSTVARVRGLLQALFRNDVLLSRILRPLHSFLTSSNPRWREVLSVVKNRLQLLSNTGIEEVTEVCWLSEIRSLPDVFIRNDLLRLLKMVLQGPATQFIRRSSLNLHESTCKCLL